MLRVEILLKELMLSYGILKDTTRTQTKDGFSCLTGTEEEEHQLTLSQDILRLHHMFLNLRHITLPLLAVTLNQVATLNHNQAVTNQVDILPQVATLPQADTPHPYPHQVVTLNQADTLNLYTPNQAYTHHHNQP
jgi:hypothetical protein